MMSLWGDGWFYISAGGFVVSTVLFVFLLGQYRAAVEAEDDAQAASPAPDPVPIAPSDKVYTPKSVVDALKAVPAARPGPEPAQAVAASPDNPAPVVASAPAPAQAAAPSAQPPRKVDTTGGLSPAVVYLQNLKMQMERLDKDIAGLKALASQQAAQTDLILKRLGELSVGGAKPASAPAAAPAPQAAPAPAARERVVEPPRSIDLELEPERPEPQSQPAPQPAASAKRRPTKSPAPAPAPAVVPLVETPQAAESVASVETLAETSAAAAAAAPEPAAAPASAPASADQTLVIEPTVARVELDGKDIPAPVRPEAEQAKAAGIQLSPAPVGSSAPAEPPEPPKPTRKGPVWPI